MDTLQALFFALFRQAYVFRVTLKRMCLALAFDYRQVTSESRQTDAFLYAALMLHETICNDDF